LIYIETLFICESERYVKISALEKGSSLHRGPVGEPEAGSVNRGLGETVKECSVSVYGSSARGSWKEGSFTGNTER
jgi:hypothetical protein